MFTGKHVPLPSEFSSDDRMQWWVQILNTQYWRFWEGIYWNNLLKQTRCFYVQSLKCRSTEVIKLPLFAEANYFVYPLPKSPLPTSHPKCRILLYFGRFYSRSKKIVLNSHVACPHLSAQKVRLNGFIPHFCKVGNQSECRTLLPTFSGSTNLAEQELKSEKFTLWDWLWIVTLFSALSEDTCPDNSFKQFNLSCYVLHHDLKTRPLADQLCAGVLVFSFSRFRFCFVI